MAEDTMLTTVKGLLGISDTNEDELLQTYLDIAGKEIIEWRYSYAAEAPEEVPSEYHNTQIFAVLAGYNIRGAEGQPSHSENGITRTFRYEDMIAYIHAHVVPYCRCL